MGKPVLKNKLITETSKGDFEDEMDKFIEHLDSYSIQYRPIAEGANIWFTALITYQEPAKEIINARRDITNPEARPTIH